MRPSSRKDRNSRRSMGYLPANGRLRRRSSRCPNPESAKTQMQVDHADGEEHFDGAEVIGDAIDGHEGQLDKPDRLQVRRVLDRRDDGVHRRRQRRPRCERQDDEECMVPALQAKGCGCVAHAVADRREACPEVLDLKGARPDSQRNDARPEDREAQAQAWQPIEDEEDLNEIRRAANELHIGRDEVFSGLEAARAQRRTNGADGARQQDREAADHQGHLQACHQVRQRIEYIVEVHRSPPFAGDDREEHPSIRLRRWQSIAGALLASA